MIMSMYKGKKESIKGVQELLITQKEAWFHHWITCAFWAVASGIQLIIPIKCKKEIMGLYGPERKKVKNFICLKKP